MEHDCPGCGGQMRQVEITPEGDIREKDGTDDGTTGGHGWKVVLFNCNCHSFQEVEMALAQAGIPNGKRFATIIHNKGSAVVFKGEPARCEAVAIILESYGLKVKITQ